MLNLWTNGFDFIVAKDKTSAIHFAAIYYGYSLPLLEEEKNELEGLGWTECKHDEILKFNIGTNVNLVLSALEWSIKFGKGYLFSTNDVF